MKQFLIIIGAAIVAFGCNRPVASFIVESEEIKAPADVQFINESENASEYTWDFGDGNTSNEKDPDHRFLRSGVYEVELTAIEGDKSRSTSKEIVVGTPDRCLVQIETSMGTMIAELYDATPKHQDNFLKLAEQGFYDSLLFHRVIQGFMIQGGDPNSKGAGKNAQLGAGGPGYRIDAEFVDTLAHLKGALAAARQGDQVNPQKQSSGSQFYIVQGKVPSENELEMMERRKGMRYTQKVRQAYLEVGGTPFLDGEYTVFGRIIEGLEVIDKIASVQTGRGDRPVENVYMKITPIR